MYYIAPPSWYDNWEELFGFPRPEWVKRSERIPVKNYVNLQSEAQKLLDNAFEQGILTRGFD